LDGRSFVVPELVGASAIATDLCPIAVQGNLIQVKIAEKDRRFIAPTSTTRDQKQNCICYDQLNN